MNKEEMILDIYKRQQTGESLKKLREEYGLSEGDYRHGRERLGLKALNRKNRLYTNESFFDCIDSEIKAYYLGLLAADGNVYKEKGNTYQIAISLRDYDAYILEPLRDALIPEREIIMSKPTRKDGCKSGGVGRFQLRNKHVGEMLIKRGIVERKSYEPGLFLPPMSQDLIKHFVRGYFDGNGHIVLTRKNSCKMGMVCMFPQILESIQKTAQDQIPLEFHFNLYQDSHKRWYLDTSSQAGALLLGSWIYQDSHYKLWRKYNKWAEFANKYLEGEYNARPYGKDNPVLSGLVKQAANVESRS